MRQPHGQLHQQAGGRSHKAPAAQGDNQLRHYPLAPLPVGRPLFNFRVGGHIYQEPSGDFKGSWRGRFSGSGAYKSDGELSRGCHSAAKQRPALGGLHSSETQKPDGELATEDDYMRELERCQPAAKAGGKPLAPTAVASLR